MIKSKIYPLNRFITHVKIIARSFSDLYSDQRNKLCGSKLLFHK